MPKLTPEEFAEKYANRLKAAVGDMRRGIERVSEAPTVKAASRQDKMRARIVEAIDSGKWADRLKRVSLEEWRSQILEKGLSRVPSGVDAARGKMAEFASQLLPYQDALKAKIKGMPDLTIEDNVNRAATWIREMAKFRKK